MISGLNDTSAAADAVMLDLLRQTPIWRKLQLVEQLNDMTRALAYSGLRQQYPNANDAELRRLWRIRLLGEEMAARLPEIE